MVFVLKFWLTLIGEKVNNKSIYRRYEGSLICIHNGERYGDSGDLARVVNISDVRYFLTSS